MIPKIVYFYWNWETPISFLRYMTLKTFVHFHRNWKIYLYMSGSKTEKTWKGYEEQDFLNYEGEDYFGFVNQMEEIKIREHTKEELSHYSSATFDIDYEYPFGSKEITGNANRGQYDLLQHQKESGESMEIFDEKYGKKVIPKVIEPTFGIERIFLALLTKAYSYDKSRDNIVLKLSPKLAPIKAAIFPIVKNPKFEKISEEIYNDLKKEFNVVQDLSGSIGRRYSRNDEIGTPYCITIDEYSPAKKDATIRERNTTKQIRVKIKDLREILKKLISQEIEFEKAGKIVETRVKLA